ncbi:hypothetical protein PCANC_15005 [Puccinia coronata f. sp. avenae]|uniref:Amino acid permease/ SLC12A domain-containing protein n=1 Tax=Puccinia coronata f. sp. avenae TaxID=200324 RepID=A0A2N5STL3_9BASI|nr:hypothetical protein PCANC_15005 [Puccinia coronata f. sp. avenae]
MASNDHRVGGANLLYLGSVIIGRSPADSISKKNEIFRLPNTDFWFCQYLLKRDTISCQYLEFCGGPQDTRKIQPARRTAPKPLTTISMRLGLRLNPELPATEPQSCQPLNHNSKDKLPTETEPPVNLHPHHSPTSPSHSYQRQHHVICQHRTLSPDLLSTGTPNMYYPQISEPSNPTPTAHKKLNAFDGVILPILLSIFHVVYFIRFNAAYFRGFGIIFPSLHGVLAGLSSSGKLHKPSKSLPSGMISASILIMIVPLATLCLSLTCSWKAFSVPHQPGFLNLIVLQIFSYLSPTSLGLLLCTLFSSVMGITVCSKILLAVSPDGQLFPVCYISTYIDPFVTSS